MSDASTEQKALGKEDAVTEVENEESKSGPGVLEEEPGEKDTQPKVKEDEDDDDDDEDDDDLFGDAEEDNAPEIKQEDASSSSDAAVTKEPEVPEAAPAGRKATATTDGAIAPSSPTATSSFVATGVLGKAEEKSQVVVSSVGQASSPARTLPGSSMSSSSMVIPKGVPSPGSVGTPSKASSLIATVKVDPTAFGFPAGVKVPPSVNASLLNGKLLDTLKTLPVNLINDALTEYDDAVDIKGGAIRSHGAYLYGVIKRYVSVHERSLSGEGTGILPMGEGLTRDVVVRLNQLVLSGFCTQSEMNEKVKGKIRMLSERDALFALDELASVDRSGIRNFGSYFMGILNRYMRGDASSKIRPNQQPQHQHNQPQPRRDSDRDRAPHHPQQQQQQQQRGRDRFYRDHPPPNNQQSYNRDRSRDRVDNNPYDKQPDPMLLRQQPYDSRQQNQPWMQHQQQQPPPPPPMYMQQQQQDPQIMLRPAPGFLPQQQQLMQQQQQPIMFQQQQPSNNFVSGGYQPQGMQHQQSMGPPPNSNMFQQPPQQQQQQQFVQSMMNQQQQPYLGNQQQQPLVGGPQMPNQQNNMSYNAPPLQGGWQLQQQQPPPNQIPVDIMGLADKAASAVQALANQSKMMPMGGGSASSFPGAPGQLLPPSSGYPQQLASAPMQMMQQPMQQMGQQPQSYPGQQQQQQSQQGPVYTGNPSQQQGQQRRRTTAGLPDLPPMVQMAVQNLQANGAIDGPLDAGMLGMVFDLPEDLALSALQKFASLNKTTMRNKTAYLAGLLRRELEKIHRR